MQARAKQDMPAPALDAAVIGDLMLVRLAAGDSAARSTLVRDLAPFAPRGLPAARFKGLVDETLRTLTAEGFIAAAAGPGVAKSRASGALAVTAKGRQRAEHYIGRARKMPRSWNEVRSTVLAARALGFSSANAAQMKALARLDGLAGAIVQSTFNLKLKGAPTPSRLRAALAVVALDRAFGGEMRSEMEAGKSGLSAKAGRLLAAKLLTKSRPAGTDSRLIAALAAEAVGATKPDFEALQAALLRRLFGAAAGGADPASASGKALRNRPKPRLVAPAPAAAPPLVAPVAKAAMPAIVSPIFVPPLPPLAHILPFAAKQPNGAPSAPMASKPAPNATAGAGRAARPDLAQFVTTVQATAAAAASGWAGNRKAYISHVWRRIEAQCPQWALTPIEFKAMLTAAHAAGRLVLANADLKDASALADVQESAIAFKNTVFHFVRVDD